MLEQVDWGDVPESDVLPTNLYVFTVADLKWVYSKNGKLGLKTQLKCEAPDLYKGTNVFNDIYIGSDEDPAGDQPDTWKRRGGQDLKKFLVGVFGDVASLTGHIPTDVEATRGATVLCLVNMEVDQKVTIKEDGVDVPNPYVGQERNRFKKWFAPTDAEAMARVGQMDVPAAPTRSGGAARPTPPAPPAAPTPPAPPVPPGNGAAAAPGTPRTQPARTAPPAPPVRPAAPPPPPPRPPSA